MSSFPSEFRRSTLSDHWVIIAGARAKRPHQWPEDTAKPGRDPFEAGNIDPSDITEALPDAEQWQALVIKNAFPYLSPGNNPDVRGYKRDGYGKAEIVIHSPRADQDFADFSDQQTALILELYHRRYLALSADPHIKYVQIFTNRGGAAGASVRHPHSQIVALPIVPGYVERLLEVAARFHEVHGGSVIEDERTREAGEKVRVVAETKDYLLYCPFAPHADYHLRIAPRKHAESFTILTDIERLELAGVLNDAFRRLRSVVGEAPYNIFIRTAPVGTPAPGFCWHIDIVPRLNPIAGLEISTQLDVVTVAPETAATTLRDAKQAPGTSPTARGKERLPKRR